MKPVLSLASWLVLVVLLGGIAVRLVHLDADPVYYGWIGYITDEGRWVAHARELALFGRINTDWLAHLFMAPLFELVSLGAFKLLGVSIWAARLPTALAGSALLILFWVSLRRVVTAPALLAALALLAFEADLIVLSRVAVPEMAAIFVQFVAYLILVTGTPSARRLFATGLLLTVAVATKATTLPSLAIFSTIALVQPLPTGQDPRRIRGLLALWAGFLAPVLLTAPVWGRFAERHLVDNLLNSAVLGRFLRPASLYSIVSLFFESPLSPVLNVWGLGVCLSMLVWLAVPREAVDPGLRRLFVTSAIWYGMYAPLMVSLEYFPDRYKIHILVAIAVNLAAGISIFQTSGLSRGAGALRFTEPGRRLLGLPLVALPTAVLWAPVLVELVTLFGPDPERLRVKVACMVAALLGTLWIVFRRAAAGRALLFFIVFPIVGTLLWLVTSKTGLTDATFWPVTGGTSLTWWMFGPWASALIAGIIARGGFGWSPALRVALISAAALCYAALSLAQVLPWYTNPHYSIRQASRDLGTSAAGETGVIVTSGAEGLFNGNALPYRTLLGKTWPARKPEIIVIAFQFADPEGLLERDYDLVSSYRLSVSPEYLDNRATMVDADAPVEIVRVYRRKPGVAP